MSMHICMEIFFIKFYKFATVCNFVILIVAPSFIYSTEGTIQGRESQNNHIFGPEFDGLDPRPRERIVEPTVGYG